MGKTTNRSNPFLKFAAKATRVINSRMKYQLFFSHVTIVILSLALAGALLLHQYSKIMLEKNHRALQQLSRQIMINLNNSISNLEKISFISSYEEDLATLTNNLQQNHYPRAITNEYRSIDNYFFNFMYSIPEIQGAYIYTAFGTNIYARNKDLSSSSTQGAEREWWFQKAIENHGRMVLLGRHTNTLANSKSEVISIARAIVDSRSNNIIGVILLDRDVSYIGNVIDNVQIGEGSAAIILDEENHNVFCNNRSVFDRLSKEGALDTGLIKQDEAYFTIGSGRTSLFATVSTVPRFNWKIAMIQPWAEVYGELASFQRLLLVLLIISLAITFLTSAFIAGKMSKRLAYMKQVATQIENGNFDTDLKVDGCDEIAALGRGLNAMLERIRRLIQVEFSEKILRKEAEINMLQAQINPHFLYNTLGSVKMLAEDEGCKNTPQMLQRLSNLFRYSIGGKKRIVTIRDELEQAMNYLALQQFRFEDRIDIQVDVAEEVLDERIPIMTIQPILENSFIHGFDLRGGPCELKLLGHHEGGYTKILVIDNGVAVSESKQKEIDLSLLSDDPVATVANDGKIGLSNAHMRIKYCFGNPYGIRLARNEIGGTTVEVLLPTNKVMENADAQASDRGR